MAREAQPRRSARLSRTQAQEQSTQGTPTVRTKLESVTERDETPEISHLKTIENVISTPTTAPSKVQAQLRELSGLRTPKTAPQPAKSLMHPSTVHRSMGDYPTSAEKLGFTDITDKPRGSMPENTPSHPRRQSLLKTSIDPAYQFKFNHDANISDQGKKLMESIREDAARIKAQMQAEREREKSADGSDTNSSVTSRRIVKAMGKSGRFSDVHSAQFKKMESIENHASAFRARPGYIKSTAQSLKRTSSKAGLDSPERPRTAGKSLAARSTPVVAVTGRVASVSPFKSIRQPDDGEENTNAKRVRRNGDADVAAARPPTTQSITSRLFSPTKASAARSSGATPMLSTPVKPSALPRANSVKSARSVRDKRVSLSPVKRPVPASTSKLPQPRSLLDKPLPPSPIQTRVSTPKRKSSIHNITKVSFADAPAPPSTASRLPTFASLKSILRSGKKETQLTTNVPKSFDFNSTVDSASKKVDFTPLVKSRYAVKLAANSPSPAKLDRSILKDDFRPAIPYDSSAFVVDYNSEDWPADEDHEQPILYPTLPGAPPRHGPVVHSFAEKAKQHNRRESKEFKSIFTTIKPKAATAQAASLTSINTNVNKSNPLAHATNVLRSPSRPGSATSQSTIRQVRTSDLAEPSSVFEDYIIANPHGLSAKKRRYASHDTASTSDLNSASQSPSRRDRTPNAIPGSFEVQEQSIIDDADDEASHRAAKRTRVSRRSTGAGSEDSEKENKSSTGVSDSARKAITPAEMFRSPAKRSVFSGVGRTSMSPQKPSAARQEAAKNAKARKTSGKVGGMSASRLNMLATPKSRG